MLKYGMAMLFLVLNIVFLNAASVEIDANIYEDQTEYVYFFNFTSEDSYKSFSFERPESSTVEYLLGSDEVDIKYSLAGDFMIVQPKKTASSSFEIKLVSESSSENIVSKGSFQTYTNFNFPVEKLIFKAKLEDEIAEIQDIFPRNYKLSEEGAIVWEIEELESDTLFLLDFGGAEIPSRFGGMLFWIIGVLVVIILITLIYAIALRKKHKKTVETAKKEIAKTKRKSTQKVNKAKKEAAKKVVTEKKQVKKKEEKVVSNYIELVNKFLTENEKEVVEVVKNHEGISQYDILNHLPKLTKSNLSKIISKLNSRKFLNRIRVGKVNKIYLGEKLDETQQVKEEPKEEN